MYKQHPTCLSHSFSIPNWRFRKWTAAIHQWNERKCDNFHSILHLMCDLFISYLFVRNTLWTDTTTHSISDNRNEKKLENCNFLFFRLLQSSFREGKKSKKKSLFTFAVPKARAEYESQRMLRNGFEFLYFCFVPTKKATLW